MVGWHHRLDGHEFEQAPGDGEGQGNLPATVHGVSESDMTERLTLLLNFFFDSPERSNQSILKEISPGCSLEGLMLKLQYFGHLM